MDNADDLIPSGHIVIDVYFEEGPLGVTLKLQITGDIVVTTIIDDSQAINLDIVVDDSLWAVDESIVGLSHLDKDTWARLVSFIKQSTRPLKMSFLRKLPIFNCDDDNDMNSIDNDDDNHINPAIQALMLSTQEAIASGDIDNNNDEAGQSSPTSKSPHSLSPRVHSALIEVSSRESGTTSPVSNYGISRATSPSITGSRTSSINDSRSSSIDRTISNDNSIYNNINFNKDCNQVEVQINEIENNNILKIISSKLFVKEENGKTSFLSKKQTNSVCLDSMLFQVGGIEKFLVVADRCIVKQGVVTIDTKGSLWNTQNKRYFYLFNVIHLTN
jgi:hypothetical protein